MTLNPQAAVGDIVEVTFHRYPTKAVLLLFYRVERQPGSPEPEALDVADVRWAAHEALREDEFPPADIVVLRKVRALVADRAG